MFSKNPPYFWCHIYIYSRAAPLGPYIRTGDIFCRMSLIFLLSPVLFFVLKFVARFSLNITARPRNHLNLSPILKYAKKCRRPYIRPCIFTLYKLGFVVLIYMRNICERFNSLNISGNCEFKLWNALLLLQWW